MAVTDIDWQQEQKRVTIVTKKIRERMKSMEDLAQNIKEDVVQIRKHFWDEVSVNVGNPDDLIETHFSIRQQAEVLAERERRYRHSFKDMQTLKKLVYSPYFGRIDFQENEAGEIEQIYLGIASFRDDDDTFLIYDWRAPISSLYYDFSPGLVQYKAPLGMISGTMSLKRQYVVRDAQIRFMFDTGVTIGDELLMQVLSRHSDAQMKSIVATIQREQNRIIRNDSSRMLVVQGAAGSGKTSAALQRVAFLLYKYRETLHADEMVLFSPNPMFNSYVSTVLPELGEENMQQTTFQEYLEHRLGKTFQLENPFSQLEYILTANDTDGDYATRLSGIRYKSSVDYLNSISSYKQILEHDGMVFKPLKFRSQIIITKDQMNEFFYHFDASITLPSRISLLQKWLRQELETFEKALLSEEWVEDEIDLLDPEDYHRAYKQMGKGHKGNGPTFNDFDREKNVLSQMVVKRHLKPLRIWIKRLRFIDIRSIYKQMFANGQFRDRAFPQNEVPELWVEICKETVHRLDNSVLAYEDATPFLYLKDFIEGVRSNNAVRHVIVDEAQDYTPFQFQFLKNLFPRAKMTALGDLNQAIYAHNAILGETNTLCAVYGTDQTEIIRLTKSYRSTREIVEFTRGMITGGDEIIPFNRSGDKPIILSVTNHTDLNRKISTDIAKLQADGFESIAIICKTEDEAITAFTALNNIRPIRLITKDTPVFVKGVMVIPAYLAKGVEFDAVIIYNGSIERYSHNRERKLFYTACTRAMHLLHIYTIGEISPFIQELNKETYVWATVYA